MIKKAIDKELFDKAIDNILLEVRPVRLSLNNATIEFFGNYSIPTELQEFLTIYSFSRPLQVGHICYDETNYMAENNLEDENRNCIEEGLLIIGAGLNGDPVVVDMETLSVGFVFHDELWEDTSLKAQSVYINTGLSIGEFYLNAATQKDSFPKDAYQAREVFEKP